MEWLINVGWLYGLKNMLRNDSILKIDEVVSHVLSMISFNSLFYRRIAA